MTGASIETTLELWASSLRDVKARMRAPLVNIPVRRVRLKIARSVCSPPMCRRMAMPLSIEPSTCPRAGLVILQSLPRPTFQKL